MAQGDSQLQGHTPSSCALGLTRAVFCGLRGRCGGNVAEDAALLGDFSKHVSFLEVVALSCPQQRGQSFHGLQHMLSLVEHDALRSLPHGCIGDLGAGRQSFLCQRL